MTLVELLIVIAIVAILAGISTSLYNQFIGRARVSAAQATLDSVKKGIMNLETDTGLWPGVDTSEECRDEGEEYEDLTDDDVGLFNNNGAFPGWRGPYLGSTFLDDSGDFTDPWGMPYFLDCDYDIDGDDYVVVGSFGPNKVGMNNYDSDNIYLVLTVTDDD